MLPAGSYAARQSNSATKFPVPVGAELDNVLHYVTIDQSINDLGRPGGGSQLCTRRPGTELFRWKNIPG